MKNFKKIDVMPQVTIYQNLLTEATEILNFLKESENKKYTDTIFPEWENWKSTAYTDGSLMKFRISQGLPKINENDAVTIKKEKKIIHKLNEVFEFVVNEYFINWSNKGICPWEIKNWDFNNKNYWQNHEFCVLKYAYTDKEKVHDPKNGFHYLPMNYHVDLSPALVERGSTQLFLTITMYLNDDYSGGEISFYDKENNQVYAYKPKPGDVTVFPSYEPFYHGVLPMGYEDRYLIRTFLLYSYEGSKNWNKEKSNFSNDEWEIIEKEKLVKSYENGQHGLRILYPGDIYSEKKYKTVNVDKDIIYINESQ